MTAEDLLTKAEFPPAGYADWRALAQKALEDVPFPGGLVSSSEDGIPIEPIHPAARHAQAWPRRRPDTPCRIVQRVDDPDVDRAGRQIQADIEGGATGLSLVFEGAPNAFGYGLPPKPEALAAVLDGLALNRIHLRVDVHPASRAMADWLLALLIKRRADPARLSLSFGIDAAAIFAGTGRLRMSIEALQASMPQSMAHFFAMGVPGVLLEADGRVYHNAGATEAQELGLMLAAAVSHLRMFEAARQPLVYAAPHIGFALSVDQDQLLSMAKLRALRQLWARVQEMCAIPASGTTIHAETSYRMMTLADPETNILRGTIACFSALAGGADSIAVLPYTLAHGLPAAFARRVARNTQLVLAAESGIGFVADPGAGSGSLEAMAEGLCEAAWREFQLIEAEGGILQSLGDGKAQARVLAARNARAEAFRQGHRLIVGTTLHPAASERAVETIPTRKRPVPRDGVAFCERLAALRIDQTIGVAA